MSEIKIEIDHDLCYGAQNCSRVAPGAFEHNDEGKAVPGDTSAATPSRSGWPSSSARRWRSASPGCPTSSRRARQRRYQRRRAAVISRRSLQSSRIGSVRPCSCGPIARSSWIPRMVAASIPSAVATCPKWISPRFA